MPMLSFFRSPFRSFLFPVLLGIAGTCYAGTGLLFDVLSKGPPQELDIVLALDGFGPISSQNYTVDGLHLTITTTIPGHKYKHAGIKLVNAPGYRIQGLPLSSDGYYLFSVSDTSAAHIVIRSPSSNPPWFPSIEAFEHYDSGRSHVFSEATFGGSYLGNNTVDTLSSKRRYYPSGYNMSYYNPEYAFIYGGGYGDIEGSIGAFVARVNPETLKPIWYKQLIDTKKNGEWDYPGSMGILQDGFIYVSYGYRLTKLDSNGKIIDTLELPTGMAKPENTSYNGFNATSDGYIVMKSVYRQDGCTIQGPDALLDCPDPSDVPDSVLVSVDPKTMTVVDTITLKTPVGARPTIGVFDGKNYVYLLEPTTAIRYEVADGKFILDNSWKPGTITLDGQTLCTSFVVINDWVVAQTNTLPAATALDVIAISQADASLVYTLQPFAGDPIPPLILAAFSMATADKTQAYSWAPMSVSADPENNLIYAADALPGKLAAITITSNGLETVWKADQRTTEFTALIGPKDKRVVVGTDIPFPEIPGNNMHDYAVWRNAATGEELARSPKLPAMTQGTMIQPYYNGDMFYEGQLGTLIKLMPRPAGED